MIEDITLLNTKTHTSIQINSQIGPYWVEKIVVGPIKGSHHTFKYLEQIGEYMDNTTLETRDVSIIAWAVDSQELPLSKAKGMVNSLCSPQQELEIVFGKYRLRFYPDSSVQWSTKEGENNDLMAKFLIQGQSFSPMWGLHSPIQTPIAYTVYGLVLPLVIPLDSGLVFGVIQPTVSARIDNQGDLPMGCIINIEATGRVDNPQINCAETQEAFLLGKTLEPGERVVIDTRVGSRSVTGIVDGVEYNYMSYMSFSSNWITLALGINTLSFSSDSGSQFLSVYVEYSPVYFEVE